MLLVTVPFGLALRWTKQADSGLSAASLAGKHVPQSFREAVDAWKHQVMKRNPFRKKDRKMDPNLENADHHTR